MEVNQIIQIVETIDKARNDLKILHEKTYGEMVWPYMQEIRRKMRQEEVTELQAFQHITKEEATQVNPERQHWLMAAVAEINASDLRKIM